MEEPLEQTISARQLGAAFSGCFLGAGYVSGREMWQFFGRFGPVGWLGLCLSIALLGGSPFKSTSAESPLLVSLE